MLNAFTNLAQVTRSHIPAANTPTKMDVPNDSHPRKRKSTSQGPEEPIGNPTIAYSLYPIHEEILDYGSVLEETNPPTENREILVYYASLDDVWRRNEMIVDDALTFAITTEIMLSDDIEPCSLDECRRRIDWSNWKQAIQIEFDLLAKHKVFGPVAHTPPHVMPVGYKWVFIQKCNRKNEIMRYKARLIA
ncbi:hypothetical protein ACFXTO_001092 [Malus domestica]